jgi:hypothetical protein
MDAGSDCLAAAILHLCQGVRAGVGGTFDELSATLVVNAIKIKLVVESDNGIKSQSKNRYAYE